MEKGATLVYGGKQLDRPGLMLQLFCKTNRENELKHSSKGVQKFFFLTFLSLIKILDLMVSILLLMAQPGKIQSCFGSVLKHFF